MPKSRKLLKDLSRRHFMRIVNRQSGSRSTAAAYSKPRPFTIADQSPSTSDDSATESVGLSQVNSAEDDNLTNSTSKSDNDVEMICEQNSILAGNNLLGQDEIILQAKPTGNRPKDTPEDILNNVRQWAVAHQITHTALHGLCAILRIHECFSNFPKDPRTIVNTPVVTKIETMVPGHYYHFGLEKMLILTLKSSTYSIFPDELKLYVNVDGLPISKSPQNDLWPILCQIKSLKDEPIFPVGIYHGGSKPADSNAFLNAFVEEAVNLVTNGLNFQGRIILVDISSLVCDAPAKSFILKTKGHTGFYSCSKCTVEGDFVDNRVCFTKLDAAKRTHLGFVNQSQEEYHTGRSILQNIPQLDLVQDVPLDYMHLICLGVVRKLLRDIWINGKVPHKLSGNQIVVASNILVACRGHIPVEFARKPRELQEIARWKATELRQFLLYTGPIVLCHVLSKEKYLHFLTLHVAVRILVCDNLCKSHLQYAESLLLHFTTSFKIIYGQKYVSHNVHGLIHVADDVRNYGVLDNYSAFPFENFMQSLKKLIRKSDKPLQQIARRYHEYATANISVTSSKRRPEEVTYVGNHCNGPLLHDCVDPQYSSLIMPKFTLQLKEGNNCCGVGNSVCIVRNICSSSSTQCMVVVGQRFDVIEDLFTQPCKSSLVGVLKVRKLSDNLELWPVASITRKYVMLPYGNDENIVFPLLHID